MADLPAGTVTFLFTDIEGSTRLWERDRAAMRVAVDRHLAILDAHIDAEGGARFKTVGDATQAAFSAAPAAIAAALNTQRTLRAQDGGTLGPLRVRMALHAGEAEPDARGDYLAAPLNRLSRLLSAGHGGQILLTQVAQGLARDAFPNGVTLRDLGHHRLRDLLEPEHVYQLLHQDLPDSFPPLKTLDQHPNNLPRQPTPFLGREREAAEIVARLRNADVQLLTLTGPGGTGKTRLALQAAADLLEDFADGVFVVPLAPLTDPTLLPSAIAGALGIQEDGGQTAADRLREFVASRQLLLVLDNFEHLVAAAPVVSELLGAAPGLKVLATSRAPLHLRAEREYPVPPLGLPGRQPPPTPEQLTQFEAVRLFIERVQAVKPDFAVDNENAPAVAEICWRLDGLPLAIELAAARIRLLPPQALLARLGKRLPVLTGGARDAPARQQTLRATIAWSHDLLSEEERTLFRRLSVFAGGCSLEAAEAVANPDGVLDALGGITSLVEQSLLRLDAETSDEPRVVMLETVSEFALEQLTMNGDEPAARRHHAEFYVALAETADSHVWTMKQAVWLNRLDMEHPNLRAGLGWALEAGDGDQSLGLALAGALGSFWRLRGHLREGLDWLQRSLAGGGAPAARLRAMGSITSIARQLQDNRLAMEVAESALALAHESGGKQEIADARQRLASALINTGDIDRPSDLLADALAWYRSAGDTVGEANVLADLVGLAEAHADFERARALAEEAQELFRAAGDYHGVAHCLFILGYLAVSDGDGDRALKLIDEAVDLFRGMGNTLDVAAAGFSLAQIYADHLGDDAAAEAFLVESLVLWQRVGNTEYAAGVLHDLGRLATRKGDLALAKTRHLEALALRQASSDPVIVAVGTSEAEIGFGDLARAHGEIAGAIASYGKALGHLRAVAPTQWRLAGVLGLWVKLITAESLRLAACTAELVTDAAQAARVLGAAESFRTASGWGVLRAERQRQDHDAASIRARLDEDAFAEAWAAGQTLSVEAAIDAALALTDEAAAKVEL